MTVKNVNPKFRLAALLASGAIASLAVSGNAFAADPNQNSSRSNNAGALLISLSDDESGDSTAQVEEMSALMLELETLLSSITDELARASALQGQISQLQGQLAQQSAGKVSYSDISIMKIVEDAATEFEARVASESGGALTADLQLQLDELVAAASSSPATDPALLEAFSSSIAEISTSLEAVSSSVEELQTKLDGSLDAAVKAGYDLKKNEKV